MKNKTRNQLRKKSKSWCVIVNKFVFGNHENYNYDSDEDLDKICTQIRKYTPEITSLLNLTLLEYKWNGWTVYNYKDYHGLETLENIKGTLSYISDRWYCDCRLYWLLQVPTSVDRIKNDE